jgi:hypothetical protein
MPSSSQILDPLANKRIERKFRMMGKDLGSVRRVLETNCSRIIHEDKVNTIHTLYFDDDAFSAYYENKDGIGRRWKARIRWYNKSTKTGLFFEFKHRHNILSAKDRFELTLPESIYKISFNDLKKELRKQLPTEEYERFMFRSTPILLNEYSREYFHDKHNNIRLTLDYDIKCFNQMGHKRVSQRYPHHLEHVSVLEVKVPVDYAQSLNKALNPLKLRLTKSSKYVQCLEAMGWGIED